MKEGEEVVELDMTPILLEDLGMKYPTKDSKQKKRYGIFKCQYCGKEFETQAHNINTGHTKSCGCLTLATHGLVKHPLYNTWLNMKNRCCNPNHKKYKDYGARGIAICNRWLDINNFIQDMYPSFRKGLSLDRMDNNGNYEPDNCRWTTQTIQVQNTRDIHSNNTSGYRGVAWHKGSGKWQSRITLNNKRVHLGIYPTALEAAKAYETYVRLNNLEHNFTPALTEEEIERLNNVKSN